MRIGTVLVFKPEVSKAKAASALNQIRHLLDLPETSYKANPEVQDAINKGLTVQFKQGDWGEFPFHITDKLEVFDPEDGFPVWYIP
jgi:hypothetical protein